MESTCPYCREPLSAGSVQECPTCHLPHHADCWEENHGCTVFGCASAPGDEPRLAVSTAEAGTTTHGANGAFVPPYPVPPPPMPPMPPLSGVTLPFAAAPIVNWIPAAVLFAISALLEMLRAARPHVVHVRGSGHFWQGAIVATILQLLLLQHVLPGQHICKVRPPDAQKVTAF